MPDRAPARAGGGTGERQVLKTADCAKLVGVCVKTLRRYVSAGLPCHPLSEHEHRFFADEVLAWIASRTPTKRPKERPCHS